MSALASDTTSADEPAARPWRGRPGWRRLASAMALCALLALVLWIGHEGWPATASIEAAPANVASAIRTIPLSKQYVPVMKGEKAVAYKTVYFGKVHAGSPAPQEFTVVFDTGSGHLILPSTSCLSDTCAKHRRFNRTASSSAVDIEVDGSPLRQGAEERDQMTIAFGTGEVLGEFVRETVCVGAALTAASDAPRKGCAQMRVVLAKSMSSDPFGAFAFDGVLGLGLSALTLSPAFNFLTSMTGQDPSVPPTFAVFLSRHDEGASAISFGGHERRFASTDFLWAPVAREELGFWHVQIRSVRIGGQELEDCADGGCGAILDTGTSLLGVPKQSARLMHRMLARPVPQNSDGSAPSSAADVDCRRVAGLPLEFELVGGAVVRLLPEDYSRPTPFNMTVQGKEQDVTPSSRLFCRSLLLPLEMGPPLGNRVFIFGEPVLRRYYTVYDAGAKRVGFSLARQQAATGPGSAAIGAPPPGSRLSGAPLQA